MPPIILIAPLLIIPGGSQLGRTHPMLIVLLVSPLALAANIVLARVSHMRWTIEHFLRDRRADLLGEGVCLACGYPLGGVVPADDGCVECPECAAAWRIQDSAAAAIDSVPAKAGASEATRTPAS